MCVKRRQSATHAPTKLLGVRSQMLPTFSREITWCQEPNATHAQPRDCLVSEGLQMWCEMIVPWMGHTKMYFPFAASEFRAADDPLSQQTFVVRSRKMWCQVEVWLDGGVLERTSPFRRTSLVPQVAAYHNKEQICCQKGLDVVLPRKLTGWGCTWAYIPIQADEGSAADDPLSQQRTNYLFLNV